MNCPDLCTAAKCRELENRILALENRLEILNDDLYNHIDNDLLLVHNFSLALTVDTEFIVETSTLKTLVKLDHNNQFVAEAEDLTVIEIEQTQIDEDYYLDLFDDININIDKIKDDIAGFNIVIDTIDDYNYKISLVIGNEFRSAYLELPEPETEPIEPTLTIEQVAKNTYKFSFGLNEIIVDDLLILEEFSLDTLNLDIKYAGNFGNTRDYLFTIYLNDLTDTAILNIPDAEPIKNVDLDIKLLDQQNQDYLISVSVDGKSDSALLNLYPVGITELDLQITDLGNYQYQFALKVDNKDTIDFLVLDMSEIINKIDEVLELLKIDFEGIFEVGTTNTNPVDDNGNKILGYSQYEQLPEENYLTYNGQGLVGLNNGLKALSQKITTVHKDLARAIDPETDFEVTYPKYCYDYVKRDDFTDTEWENLPEETRNKIEATEEEKRINFFTNNPVFKGIAASTVGLLTNTKIIPNIPVGIAANMIGNIALNQLSADNEKGCPWLEEKNYETVTIFASPEVRAEVRDTLLVLDFTTVQDYPRRNEKGEKWRVQIPVPKDNIDWNSLKDIRWYRGKLFGTLNFTERINFTSGWFKTQQHGVDYFNQIAALSKLTVERTRFTENSNSKISPVEIETRVYRGFKVFISDNGEPDSALTETLKPPKTDY